ARLRGAGAAGVRGRAGPVLLVWSASRGLDGRLGRGAAPQEEEAPGRPTGLLSGAGMSMGSKENDDDLSLTALREQVDRVNRELLERLQERAALVLEIAEVKRARGLEGFDPGREDAMLNDLLGRSRGPFGATELRTIF